MKRPLSTLARFSLLSMLAAPVPAQPALPRWPGIVPLVGGRERPGQAACAWMCERRSAFALVGGRDSLRVEREEPLPGGGSRVLLRQLWHGLPVDGADARLIVSADGRLSAVIPNLAPDLDAPLAPRISPDRAAATAGPAAGPAAIGAPTLAVQRRRDADHLIWIADGRRAGGERVQAIVDAVTGEVLDVDAGVSHAVGLVYPTDPRGPLEERELPRLLPGSGLSSSEIGIEDETAPPVVAVTPGDYRLDPSAPGFDQVNLYWHVDHALHDFFMPLGYAGPPEPLFIRIHFKLEPEVGRTDGQLITLGLPIQGYTRETSRADDIVYHELGHTVLYSFGIRPGGPNREANALHEGLADYFAAAFTGDPVIGEWEYPVFPNGCTRLDRPVPPWDMAHYDRVAFGGGGISSPWGNGMILGSGLWDLRQLIGPVCDSLVFEALAYLPTIPTWAQFVNGLYHADHDHHDGAYWRTIGDVLGRRGIHGVVTASISGPTVLSPGEPAEFHALDCCGGTPGSYHWQVRSRCRGVPCGPWRDLGEGDSVRTSFVGDSDLQLSVQSPFGDTATALVSVSVSTPSLVFTGPARVVKGAVGTWGLRVVAASGWGLSVYRQWLVAGRPQELLGSATSYTFAATDPFRLTATVTDQERRSATAQINVETFTDRPPKAADVFVRLTQFLEASRHAEVHLELAQAAIVRLGLYDVRGRERLLLADESAPRGERIYRWDPGTVEPGVYFLRATTSTGHDANLRFVVLR